MSLSPILASVLSLPQRSSTATSRARVCSLHKTIVSFKNVLPGLILHLNFLCKSLSLDKSVRCAWP